MKDRITNILAEMPSVSGWKLKITKSRSSELFYVSKKLETNRAADTEDFELTIYVDKDQERGASTFTVGPFMTDAELREKIEENVYAAGFAMNPWYDLPKPENAVIPESSSNIREMPLKEAAELVSDAVFAADHYDDGYLSATEIFITKTTLEILNSRGVDVRSTTYGGMVELIPSWEKDGEEVEIYHMLRFESIDPADITAKVDEQLKLARARYEAKPLAEVIDMKQPVRILVQDDEAGELLDYFGMDLTYGQKYEKSNKFELGDDVQGEKPTGTRLNITMVPYIKNAFASAFFDQDGVILRETQLVRDGIAVGRYGSYRYGYYLGEKQPSGILPVMKVEPGTKTFAEMTKEPYLRCVTFSGIQMEPNSGFFGGEVRLGFYFDGEKEIPVTGFSISGDMNVSRGTMVYSAETVTTRFYHGPKDLEIKDMKLA